jgi:hypothetical protein
VAVGLVLGAGGALVVTRVLSGTLFGVGTADPVTFTGVAALLFGSALCAAVLPALRAARLDPGMVLPRG